MMDAEVKIYRKSRGQLVTVERIERSIAPLEPEPSTDDRIAALETELRGMKERAAAVTNGDAVKVRDAIVGTSIKASR